MVQSTKGGSLVGSGSEHLLSKDGSLGTVVQRTKDGSDWEAMI